MSIEIHRINVELSYIDDFEKFLRILINTVYSGDREEIKYFITKLDLKPYDNKKDGGKILPIIDFERHNVSSQYSKSPSGDNVIVCDSKEELINMIVAVVKSSTKKFDDSCGSGYHYGFNGDDGSVEIGYKINEKKDDFPFSGNFTISLMHLYFGK